MLRFLLLMGRATVEARGLQSAPQEQRSAWMRSVAQRALRILHVDIVTLGEPPTSGMLVSNHLGYLDVLVYGAIVEPVFLSKAEVATWPVLGLLTRTTGALFVQRESRAAAVQAQQELADALRAGRLVLVFPEGTSTPGDTVLPFHSPMFQAPVAAAAPVHTAALNYTVPGANPATEREQVRQRVCYWGDMTIGPHIFGLMQLRSVRAEVRFAKGASESFAASASKATDRRTLATATHDAVANLYTAMHPEAAPAAASETPHD